MSGFDLLSLNPTFLEMVINKLDEKSYFRLQQTNKIMNEFIHNNKNICVHLSESYDFYNVYFKNEERERCCTEMDLECLYGVQFAELRLLYNFFSNPEKYKSSCDLLKKYRITCDKLDLSFPFRPSPEEIMMLINVVKPRIANGVFHWDDHADRCKALLQTGLKTLKEVYVSLNLENTATLVPQLFSKFPAVHITSRICSTEEQVELLHTMLKILRSQSFPKLENFSLRSYPAGKFPSFFTTKFDDVKEKFQDLNWTYENKCKYEDDDEIYAEEKFIAILELSNGPCKVVWENTSEFTGSHLTMKLGNHK